MKLLAVVLSLVSLASGQMTLTRGGQGTNGTVSAPTAVDIVIHANTSTVGTQITAPILASSTDQQSLLATWTAAGTQANFLLGTGANNLINGFTVRNNSDAYTSASPGKTLALSNAAAFTTWAQTGIPTTHKAMTAAGYLTLGPAATGASNTLFDEINTQTVDGHSSIIQLRTGGTQALAGSPPAAGSSVACTASAYVLEIETNPSFSTTHSACITVVPGTTYWVSLKTDSVAGNSDLYVYTLAPLTLLGHVTGNFGITSSDVSAITFGNGESGTAAATTSFQWWAMDWTNAASPITP